MPFLAPRPRAGTASISLGGVKPFVNAVGRPEDGPHPCPCCRYLTLGERSGYEICPVCFWEDDGQDDHDADEVRGGPNYHLSLTQARRNYAAYGACDERSVRHVRPPEPGELPAR